MLKVATHQSVMLNESIQALNINESGIYVDGTFGLGGHSKLILSKLTTYGRLIAIDRDYEAIKIGKLLLKGDVRFKIIHTTFSRMFECIQNMGYVGLVNGILLDLGVCSLQLTDGSRGFSFINDGSLDMRMDVSSGRSASEWLSKASLEEITWVLQTFGEERYARKIARAIVFQRKYQPILRSYTLSKLISNVVAYRNGRKHPATRSFLAIRMYINSELEEIKQVLQDSLKILSPQGRLVVISFNSLEDRIVKSFIYQNSCIAFLPSKLPLTEDQIFNRYKDKCALKNIGKFTPSIQEIKKNVCARSAILRCAEKVSCIYEKKTTI